MAADLVYEVQCKWVVPFAIGDYSDALHFDHKPEADEIAGQAWARHDVFRTAEAEALRPKAPEELAAAAQAEIDELTARRQALDARVAEIATLSAELSLQVALPEQKGG